MPKVSIVLPSYNGEHYLKESIQSIQNQSFVDWELIVVDDCSLDQTYYIAKEFAFNDNRIKVIHNEYNQKLPQSLNIGFQNATGEYYTWTSDDNIYESDAIGTMVDFLDAHPDAPMVRADMLIIDEHSEYVKKGTAFDTEKMFVNNCVGACFLYRRGVARKVGDYDISLYGVEDYDYWLRVIMECGNISDIGEALYRYRIHATSLTSTKYDMIEHNLNLMRIKNLNYYKKQMMGDEDKEFLFYLMFGEDKLNEPEIAEKLKSNRYVRSDGYYDKKKSCVVYGAGLYGQKAYGLLADKIAYYVDRNTELIDGEINGIKIKSIAEFLQQKEKYNLIIALSLDYILECVKMLTENGVYKFCTFPYLKKLMEDENE